MKILQVNCVFRTGSTGKIMEDIHSELQKKNIRSVVCYGHGKQYAEPNVYCFGSHLEGKLDAVRSRLTGLMYGGCFFSTSKLIGIIRREKPDIVHLHCINGHVVNIYRLITWLKKNHVKTVLTLHAEFMHTANCGQAYDCEKWKTGCGKCPRLRQETASWLFDGTARSWKKMKKAFDGFEKDCLVSSVSPWLMKRAESSPILCNLQHTTVLNGVDTSVFYPHGGEAIRKKLGIGDRKMVLHVTANFSLDPDHIKGGYYVVELAKRLPEMVFVVVGSRDTTLKLPENVINVGRLENQQELAAYYSAADISLLTSKQETFSMVVAESLCCGTSVVGFKAGAPEEIALSDCSAFADYGDLETLQQLLGQYCTMTVDADRAHRIYNRSQMACGYIHCYEKMKSTLEC